MKIGHIIAITFSSWLAISSTYAADKWVITKSSTSGSCTVQKETSRPHLGTVVGTYDTKEAAEKALAKMKKDGTCN